MTIGNFDGVHRGHKKLLTYVVTRARALSLPSLAMTFDPHPQRVIMGPSAPPLILPMEERAKKMGNTGLDCLVCIGFTREFAHLTPSAFVRDFLVRVIKPAEVCVGPNFTFGRGAKGRVEDLVGYGERAGFAVTIIDTQRIGRAIVSSTRIRTLLYEGKVREAAGLLGYPYSITGTVVSGTGRGREMGFPTANIETTWEVFLKDGVYAVRARLNGRPYAGALNLGTRPTFGGTRRTIEVFILNFSDNIYGKTMTVEFIERIRDEKAFKSVEDLIREIEKDVRKVRRIVGLTQGEENRT